LLAELALPAVVYPIHLGVCYPLGTASPGGDVSQQGKGIGRPMVADLEERVKERGALSCLELGDDGREISSAAHLNRAEAKQTSHIPTRRVAWLVQR
jgi:hypothetical protein